MKMVYGFYALSVLLLGGCSTLGGYQVDQEHRNTVELNNPEGWYTTYAIRVGAQIEPLKTVTTAAGQIELQIPSNQPVEIHVSSTKSRHNHCYSSFQIMVGEHKHYIFEPQIIDAQLFKPIQCPVNIFEQDAHGDLIVVKVA